MGSGKEAKEGEEVRSLASRPLAEERSVPRVPSMKGGRPMIAYSS